MGGRMTKQAELVKICDCPAIQEKYKPKYGDEIFCTQSKTVYFLNYPIDFDRTDIWLPRIEDVYEILKEKRTAGQAKLVLMSMIFKKEKQDPRLACLAALKQVLEGG